MSVTNEILMAFVDGELSPDEARRVEAELRTRPDLAAYVEQQRELRQRMHASFDAVMTAPLPSKLREAVDETRASLRWRIAHSWRNTSRRVIWISVPVSALAAGVIIGVLLSSHASRLMDVRGQTLVARGSLASALSNQLAAAGPAQGPQIGISFRDKNGHYCRTFSTPTMGGVACRDAAGWNIAALSQRSAEPNGAYGTAASAMPDIVRDAVHGMIAGAPLDAAGEARAKRQGWRIR